ncbi:hypothetical protein U1Q18_032911 [Sarracenia purpurea var. burkii]
MDANGRGGRPPGEEHLLKAQESDRRNAAAAQILTIVDVLAAAFETHSNNRLDCVFKEPNESEFAGEISESEFAGEFAGEISDSREFAGEFSDSREYTCWGNF